MNDHDDTLERALRAWAPMYRAVQAFDAWQAHHEQCEAGCNPGDDGMAGVAVRCLEGSLLWNAVHDRNRRAVDATRLPCWCEDAQDPAELVGQPWRRAPVEVGAG